MPSHGVFHHLEEHRAVAGGADLELVQQLNCGSTVAFHVPFRSVPVVSFRSVWSRLVPFGSVWFRPVPFRIDVLIHVGSRCKHASNREGK